MESLFLKKYRLLDNYFTDAPQAQEKSEDSIGRGRSRSGGERDANADQNLDWEELKRRQEEEEERARREEERELAAARARRMQQVHNMGSSTSSSVAGGRSIQVGKGFLPMKKGKKGFFIFFLQKSLGQFQTL